MKKSISFCDICHTTVECDNQSVKNINGACIVLGYSIGGWGYRQNFVDFSGEICEMCYFEYEKISNAIKFWLEKRSGSRAPEIIISENSISINNKI